VSHEFEVKDSGQRIDYPSGMRRDVQTGKARYDLIDLDFLERVAIHMTKGAEKYGEHNWRKANSQEEADRFRASAFRHMIQWLRRETDEDHMAAVAFNLAAYEYVIKRISNAGP